MNSMGMNRMLGTAIAAIVVTAAVGAQSTGDMKKLSNDGMMNMTYTGCVEVVNHGAMFMLTEVDAGAHPMQGAPAMKHDDTMPSKPIVLAGNSAIQKHIGQKVAVTGALSSGAMGTMRQDLSTLTVDTLKVVAKSCAPS
jgi:hypothetical protein